MKQFYWRDFEIYLLRNIFGRMLEEVIGGSIKLHDEKLHMYSSSDIIRIMKLRRMRWVMYVERTEDVIHA
jgi:hypothetical protein